MKMRTAVLALGLLPGFLALAALTAAPLAAQDASQQPGEARGRGMGGGMFGMMQNSAHGTVTALSGSSLTIKDEQGQVWKIETGPNTHFRKDREESKFSDIHTGDVIVAAGNLDEQAKTVGAVFVVVLDPQQAQRMEQMRADFGKTWTTGQVTAIKDLTVTVERPDKVSQTIAVDENTTFHKRGQDITFPEIKVGDRVMARGSLRNGSFLATNLSVMGERGEGRPHGAYPGQGAPPTPQPEGSPTGTTPAQPQN